MRARGQRGFTVLELMVSSAIASIVAMGVFALMTGQIEGQNRQERVSNAQMLVRAAMMEVTKRVQPTGFGLPGDWAIGVTGSVNNVTTPGPMETCPGTDVLEVFARDPRGRWTLTGNAGASITFDDPPEMTADRPWRQGVRLFLFGSIGNYGLVRTAAPRPITAQTITITAAESMYLPPPPAPQAPTTPTSEVYGVVTTRLRVVCSATDPTHPLLVLEEDVDQDPVDGIIDAKDQVPIASDIEDLQVAYLVDRDRDGVVTEADAVDHPTLATDPNFLRPIDRWRAVKGVRISLVARAKSQPNTTNLPLVVEDHAPPQVPDEYVRRLLRQVIIFDNRDTAEPEVYLHLSNKVL
ncbi:MAG: PilW family protein [Deltaproteobacteria bacterium]|nr:PilW family protein [Deltaproteobacteria bacterium]